MSAMVVGGCSAIPDQLKPWPNWVCWKNVERDGKPTKVPVSPSTGYEAKANDSDTWADFDTAMDFYEAHAGNSIAGIGFEFGQSPYVGVDLDHCRDAVTGEIEAWAEEIIDTMNTYTEISPSGTGVHMIAIGQLPPKGRRKGNIEMYSTGRYFTVTGNHLEGTPQIIEKRNAQLQAVHAKHIGQPEEPAKQAERPQTSTLNISDADLLRKAESASNGDKFKKLWSGEFSDYPSQSEADMALCLHLAFWSGNDSDRIDKLFKESGLYRPKWDQKHASDGTTYGQMSVRRAIEQTAETYRATPRATARDVVTVEAPQHTTPAVDPLSFPDIMSGLAGDFADIYSARLEVPKHFFFMGFLTCMGNIIADRVNIDSELRTEPRLFTLLLGQSADDRKSTALTKVTEFFRETIQEFNVCWGVGSAEGLQEKLSSGNKLLLCFDEFKQFVSKCKIESSVLLPCVNTLFENTWYESRTRQKAIELRDVHLSVLAASTIDTYERTWDPSFTDIGFNNRLFLVPGSGRKKFAIPEKVPEGLKSDLRKRLSIILKATARHIDYHLKSEALSAYEEWYLKREQGSIHSRRLETYAIRLMILLAANSLKDEVDADTVKQAIQLCDWQFKVRLLHDPIDADNRAAAMEEKIRRVLRAKGPLTERELRRQTHADRTGLWLLQVARQNLQKSREVKYDTKTQRWSYAL